MWSTESEGEKTTYFICRLYSQENFLMLSLIKYWNKLNKKALESL